MAIFLGHGLGGAGNGEEESGKTVSVLKRGTNPCFQQSGACYLGIELCISYEAERK